MFSFFSADYTINLDVKNRKPAYLGDDEVEGVVYFDVKKNGLHYNNICLALLGQERTAVHWTTRHGTGKNSTTQHHYAYGNRSVVRLPITLETFHGSVGKAKKAYPFKIKLPSEMPPTIPRINRSKDDWAELTYCLKVVVTKPGMLWGQSESAFDFPINIAGSRVNPQFQSTGPARMEPHTFPVTTCCCFSKGTVTAGAIGEKTLCSCERDILPVRFALGNNSTAEIDHVDVVINAHASWTLKGHARSDSWTVAQHAANTLEIEGGAALSKSSKQRGEVTASDEDIFHKLEDGGGYKTALEYRNERPSYYGSLFKIEHHLAVTVMTPCCTSNPELRTPLKLASIDPTMRSFPVAEAEFIPEAEKQDYTVCGLAESNDADLIYGGTARDENDDAPPPYEAPIINGSSFETMLKEMKASMYDVSIVDKYIAASHPFIATLSSQQLSALLAEVDDIYVNKEIAEKLLLAIQRPLGVEDIVVVLPHLYTSTQKAEFINNFLSRCNVDQAGKGRIKAELSAVEIMLLGSTLD